MQVVQLPLVSSVRREATSTGTFTAKTNKLRPGDVFTLSGVAARNLNTASKVIDIGVMRGGRTFYLTSVTLTTAGIWYFTEFHVKIPSDYQIVFRIITPTAGDAYTFNIFGYLDPCSPEHIVDD